jgi:hypothetical protein
MHRPIRSAGILRTHHAHAPEETEMTNAVPRALLLAATIAVPQLGAAADLAIQPAPEGVWAIVGKKVRRSPENLVNNATFGLVVTPQGAVLIDPGGSWKGAAALDAAFAA